MAPSNYDAIREENRARYGTVGAKKSGKLAAERYDDSTHFIFELLQNAEDALRRRSDWHGPRKSTFSLTRARLTLSHYGQPFDEADVRSVCDFDESTKNELSIGRFGIGFKSVYTVTDRPEIHSGDEDFAIDGYVFPQRVDPTTRAADETQIVLPLRPDDETAFEKIARGFQHLGAGALLFLRHIDEINWSVDGGALGVYLRSAAEPLGQDVQRVTLIGQQSNKPDVDQSWLVFHRAVLSATRKTVGHVEVAFPLVPVKDAPERWSVQQVATSPLVVFFPTVVSTNLGFLVQGPYRTTPSRDNVPRNDPWNQGLVQQTAILLVDAVRWMRDNGMLDTAALRCLPTDRAKFPEGAMFAPIFDAIRQAFFDEALLPRFDGGFVSAGLARLARTQELRDLLSAEQVESLFGTSGCAWITGDITQDKTPELRRYLLSELAVPEITPEQVVLKLDKKFLEAQSDEWITRLYAFLNGQKAIASRFSTIPLVRLDDGAHVVARENGRANAFLPSAIETSFPIVRRAVSATSEARGFLVSLGLTEPDPVDDVVWNVLPKYRATEVDSDEKAYSADIERIRTAYETDSKTQRDRLVAALRETPFVMVVDTGDGKDYVSKPGEIYVATDRLKALFAGVPRVFVVDDDYDCLRGEAMRELLEACGALRYPRPVSAPHALSYSDLLELRRQSGYEWTSGRNDVVFNWELLGFESLLALLPTLSAEQRLERARLIWESLGDLEERRGRGVFDGSYSWTHNGRYRAPPFAAAFLRRLNKSAWVPDASGELVRTALVTFESLGWKDNPFLQSKIAFKPPIIDQLAREAGIEPAALDLLRKLGITSVAELNRLGIASNPADSSADETDEGVETQDLDGDIADSDLTVAVTSTSTGLESDIGARTDVDSNDLDGTADNDLNVTAAGSSRADDELDVGAPAGGDSNNFDDGAADNDLNGAAACPLETDAEPDLDAPSGDEVRDDTKEVARERGQLTNGNRGARSTVDANQHHQRAARLDRRNVTGQSGFDEQATRLGRRVASFFDGAAPDAEDEDRNVASVGWQAKLVCLDVAAGGLQLEIGPLDGLLSFVKKLRLIGSENWDAFVLAANARTRPTRVPVRAGTGPWRWEAVGFEEEELGLDRLALDALDVRTPIAFRIDADGVGQCIKSATLSLGQAYRLLLPPNVGDEVGTELDGGWRIWSLDLAAQLSPATREMLDVLGLVIGEAWPRLDWALAPASAWRTNARGESYPAFEEGTEVLVSVGAVSVEGGDEAVLFLHGRSGMERLPVSASGIVSLGAPAAGRWACALMHSRTSVQTTTVVFEVIKNAAEHVAATWTVSVPHGIGSLEVTAPPGWPISVRWSGLAAHEDSLATLYGNDDGTATFEGIRPLVDARAARAPVADLVIDFRELGRRMIPHNGRASLDQVREQLTALWHQRSGLVQSCAGAWLQLYPVWFEPVTTRFGYGIESRALLTDVEAPHDLAAWLLTVDERIMGSVARSPSRVLVLTTDIDAVLRSCRAWVDGACTVAKVRDAIVTDGTRWTTHRMGDRQLKRREWNLGHIIGLGSLDDMLNDFTEGL